MISVFRARMVPDTNIFKTTQFASFCSLKYSYVNKIWIGMLPAERPVLIPGTFDMISISRAFVSIVSELHIEHKVQKNVNVITEEKIICACITHTVHDSNWYLLYSGDRASRYNSNK